MTEEIKPGYTRVTEIFKQWDRYGAKGIDAAIVAKKGILGTSVHEAIDRYLNGVPPEIVKATLTDKAMPYFESFLQWNDTVKPLYIEKEQRLYDDDMMITGKFDAIVQFPYSEEKCLVDYKTSAAEDVKLWPLQAMFYYYLAEKNKRVVSRRFIFLQLDREGDFPKVYEYKFSEPLWRVCQAAWMCYRYLNS